MKKRFSAQQLYNVRNRIPIQDVIESLLAIPSETVQGVFRFRCPLCAGRHTAIKPETNLSRCFQCGKNFNAIDLCMLVRHTDFVESVTFLIEHKKSLSTGESLSASGSHGNHLEPKRAPSKGPTALNALNEILATLIGKDLQKTAPQEFPPQDDIIEIERIVRDLSQILQRLKTNLHNPS